jgi:two-component system OmpR family sensor kinase
MEPVEVSPLVRETVDAFKSGFSDDDVRISVVENGASLVVLADTVALEQAVVNLLDNAVKYSERIKNITVRVFRSASDAVIEVSDQGIGIAEPDHARVFEKFYRGKGASMDRQGFGLGLAIVRELVSAHHGSIELDSRPGHGSTFRMRIPLARGSKASQMVRVRDGWDRSWLSRTASDGWRRMVGRRVEGR